MILLVLLVIVFLAGYALASSKYHEPVDKALQQPKKWWDRLFHREKSGKSS